MSNVSNEKFIIHTDGGSRGNPGPGAIGAVIKSANGTLKKEYGEFIGNDVTNNEAEYKAVIFALKKLKQLIGKEKAAHSYVDIFVDSELLERQMNKKFKVSDREIGQFFLQVWNLTMDFGEVTFNHVFREKNKEADRLVNAVLDKEVNKLL
ncbi:MAG: ribonuclease HI family protein [Parcubacteria group bacterium]